MELTVSSYSRYNNFDFFRFCLAVVVIFSHSFAITYGDNLREPCFRLTHGQAESGAIAVDFFFVISGFLVTQSWHYSSDWASFAKKRLLRIYPGFVTALLFCVAIIGTLETVSLHMYFRSAQTYLFFKPLLVLGIANTLPGVFENAPLKGQVDTSTWTIPYEITCYVLVALIGLLGLYRKKWIILCLFVCSLFIYNYLAFCRINLPHLPSNGPPRLFTFFLSGMVFYLYRDVFPRSSCLALLSAALVVVATFGCLSILLPIFGTYLLLYAVFLLD